MADSSKEAQTKHRNISMEQQCQYQMFINNGIKEKQRERYLNSAKEPQAV